MASWLENLGNKLQFLENRFNEHIFSEPQKTASKLASLVNKNPPYRHNPQDFSSVLKISKKINTFPIGNTYLDLLTIKRELIVS